MLEHKFTKSDIIPILVNLIPLFGVWFWGWNAAQVFLVYSLETIIIGVVNIVKMAIVTIFVKPKDVWENQGSRNLVSGWFFILFFILHYGFFVFVQTQIFFAVSGVIKSGSAFSFSQYAAIPEALGPDGRLLILIFIGYHILQAYLNFIRTGAYKKISMGRLMFQPYIRIFIQQFIVIFGSLFLSMGAGKIFIVVVVLVNIFFELFVNFDQIMQRVEKMKKEEGENLNL